MMFSLSSALALGFLVAQMMPVFCVEKDAGACEPDSQAVIYVQGHPDVGGSTICCESAKCVCVRPGDLAKMHRSPGAHVFYVSDEHDTGKPTACCATAKVIQLGHGSPSELAVVTAGPHEKAEARYVVVAGEDPAESLHEFYNVTSRPKKWIGVRLTPVPAPLAAHVGGDGLMIANVVNGSPADLAGLDRYDIVLAFDGQKIHNMEDLVEAIEDVKAGTGAEIIVIRGGDQKVMAVAPGKRPDSGEVEYKYDEPEEDIIDQSLKLRGHTLRPGPGGDWILEELGPMQKLPEMLGKLHELHLDDLDIDIDDDDLDFDVKVLPGGGVPLLWHTDDDGDVRIEVRVEVDEDGNVMTIQRDAGGEITVKRVEVDGDELIKSFESEDEFEDEDLDGYRVYRRYLGRRAPAVTPRMPQLKQLGKMRKEFQINVEKKLQEALERSREAHEKAERAMERARARYEKESKVLKRGRAGTRELSKETITVRMEDGRITIAVVKDGVEKIYDFENKQELRETEPDLYERVKDIFR